VKGRRRGPGAGLRLLLACLLCQLLGTIHAETIEIDTAGDPDSRLEIRNYVLPDGSEAVLYILEANPVTITIGEQELTARYVEVDLTNREIRVVGPGAFFNGSERIEGTDLVIELAEETFQSRDVLIMTDEVDIIGTDAYRVPGQISVTDGYFSPCSRCGQVVDDYGFRAGRIELFPGDRLVAFDVTMLVRGRNIVNLPFLVVPLAPQERQPRLLIEQGTETERARVSLDWPYAAGANAYGTFSIRYYADIDPGDRSGLSGRLLGGSVDTAYLGGGINHRFYTTTGAGSFRLSFVPSFLVAGDSGEREPALLDFRFEWQTGVDPASLDGPASEVLVERDDERRFGLVEFRTQLTQVHDDVTLTFLTRDFLDLYADDQVTDPSWFDRRNPRRILLDLSVSPTDPAPLTVGPLRLSRLLLELGVFEDAASPAMRMQASRALLQAARLREQHSVELLPLPLWSGFELRGQTSFSGHYYSTGQRLIDWNTRVTGLQRLGSLGQLNLTFVRDVTEGETPFRFDQLTLRERTDVQGVLSLTPLEWLALDFRSSFVFTDSRNPRAEGWRPLESRLTLFSNLSWLDVVISNNRNLQSGDPGSLTSEVTLRTPGRGISGSITASYTHDLDPERAGEDGEALNDTATRVRGSLTTSDFRVEFSWGHNFEPALPADPAEAPEYWEPFELSVTAGSLRQGDRRAGFRVIYSYDLNEDRIRTLEYEIRFRLAELEVNANQRYRLPQGGTERSRLRVSWPGVAQLEATGFELLPGTWLGVTEPEPAVRNYALALTDAPQVGPQLWQIRYSTSFDPNLVTRGGATGGRRNTTLELRALAEEELLGSTRFSVDLFVDLPLRDDQLASGYLRRANLTLGTDFAGRVGLQGTLGYRGTYSAALDEVTRGELRIDGLALTVRVRDDLYLGAVLNDVWDLTGNNPQQAAFNLQPEFVVIWNRCCWALHGSWNSSTGQVKVALTTPGADTGLVEVIETPLLLPGRHAEAGR
jgi:hypothetical protein